MPRTGVLLALLSTVVLGVAFEPIVIAGQKHAHREVARYVCPMHAEVTSTKPGTCTVCGMTLQRVDVPGSGAYRLELQTTPDTVEAGRPFALKLTVRVEGQQDPVSAFTVVHEKPFHLFVISRDLEQYNHVHPSQDRTGAWVQELTIPEPGEYRVYADLLPKGGTPQVLESTLAVKGPAGTQVAPPTPPEPDSVLERTVGTMRVRLTPPDGGLVAAGHQPLRFQFTDARTGAPIRDIEPYLGAWGHTVMVSGDTEHFVHAHPAEPLTGRSGGPHLTFHAAPPAPGIYRIWTQIKRQGTVETVVFTLPVKSQR